MSIRVRHLEFSYREFTLRVAELDFETSKITAVVGPNGAGKSTLLKCLGAVLPAEKGSIVLEGRNLAEIDGRERAKLVTYVPQEQAPTFDYTVLDYVVMGRAGGMSLFSTPSDKDVRIALEALEYVGLDRCAGRSHLRLSSGERRLVLIARALAQQADVLLLDEPTTFLDPKHEIEVMSLIRRLSEERKKTILVTLHNLEMAVRYSDDMVFMKNGGIVAAGPAPGVVTEELLERIYDLPMRLLDFESKILIVR